MNKKRRTCPNIEVNASGCPCPEDCVRKGSCCECIEYHAAFGEVPFCINHLAKAGALNPAGRLPEDVKADKDAFPPDGPVKDGQPARKGPYKLDDPDFRLIDFAKCAG
jgi:hypothetical protein